MKDAGSRAALLWYRGGATFGDALPALGPELQAVSEVASREAKVDRRERASPIPSRQWGGREQASRVAISLARQRTCAQGEVA
jgi:hypothetical protein